MNINYNNSVFPSQVVSDAEKSSIEYGRQVARAIESEWFAQGRTNGNRYLTTWNNYNRLRLYARGEQPTQKYKDELSINGDLSYLNLDWKPVPIISKFVDILTNGISNKDYDINVFAQDPDSVEKRTNYAEMLAQDMFARDVMKQITSTLGSQLFNTDIPEDQMPQTAEELELHMQLSYKQSIEIAEEEAINQVLNVNRWDLIRRRINYDLVTCGIGAVKTNFNVSNGITIDYVDPANLVYSYTEDPNFEDIYYVGELKMVTLPEIAKQFPSLDNELEKIQQDYAEKVEEKQINEAAFQDGKDEFVYANKDKIVEGLQKQNEELENTDFLEGHKNPSFLDPMLDVPTISEKEQFQIDKVNAEAKEKFAKETSYLDIGKAVIDQEWIVLHL